MLNGSVATARVAYVIAGFALFAGGLYHDGWLSASGHVTVWPAADGWVRGVLRFPLSLPPPPRAERTVLQLDGPGAKSRIVVLPGKTAVLRLRVSHHGPWQLNFHATRPGYLQDGRTVSVRAEMPSFSRSR